MRIFYFRLENQAAPNNSEISRDGMANTSPRDSIETSAVASASFTVTSSAVVPSAMISTQASSVCASSDFPVTTPWTHMERDRFGRFKESLGDGQKTKDEGQKQRDKVCANVSKWKRNFVYNTTSRKSRLLDQMLVKPTYLKVMLRKPAQILSSVKPQGTQELVPQQVLVRRIKMLK